MDAYDAHLQHLRDLVATHRYAILFVGYGGCGVAGCCGAPSPEPWSYTVGLSDAGLPELVLLGLDPEQAYALLHHFADAALDGSPYAIDEHTRVSGRGAKLAPVPVDWLFTDLDRMGTWFSLCTPSDHDFKFPDVQQVLWADAAGRFPDEPGCARSVVEQQPVLFLDPISHPVDERTLKRRTRHRRRAA